MAALTVLCATKGRACLDLMVRSHQLAGPAKLIVLGDGVAEPPAPLPPEVEWRPRPKAHIGVCGHLHLWEAMNAGVTGEWLTFMGDDDVWLPDAFFFLDHLLARASEEVVALWYPTTRGVVRARGYRMWWRNRPPFPPIGNGFGSDGEFYSAMAARGRAVRTNELVMIGRAVFLTAKQWVDLRLDRVAPWDPTWEHSRSREDEWPSGKPFGFQSVPKEEA